MAFGKFLLVLLTILILSVAKGYEDETAESLSRSSFPPEFLWGSASAAFQHEGGANEGGRAPSMWDTFVENYPEKVSGHRKGKFGADLYHHYKEDVNIMKDIGFELFRFSISWSRVLPSGKLSGGVNQEGVRFYNNLIDELISNGLQPFVTIFHWDIPQALQDEYGGFLNPEIVKDFKGYAEFCFRQFGDRVKYWTTLNEPWVYAKFGYADGTLAPYRCSDNCPAGDAATEPYIVGHHLLLSHAAAVNVYRSKYQTIQNGKIGIVNQVAWMKPFTGSDTEAANRAQAFYYGWMMDPVVFGRYPEEMETLVGERLPKFSTEQSSLLRGSYDFIGLNHYSSFFAINVTCTNQNKSYNTDLCIEQTGERDGVSVGIKDEDYAFQRYPEGLHELLLYTKRKYNNPVIYITENGNGDLDKGKASIEDDKRIEFYHGYISSLRRAINDGVDVRGYIAWSLLDGFEWSAGYTQRFGLVFVDYEDEFKRSPKKSALWFKNFLRKSD